MIAHAWQILVVALPDPLDVKDNHLLSLAGWNPCGCPATGNPMVLLTCPPSSESAADDLLDRVERLPEEF